MTLGNHGNYFHTADKKGGDLQNIIKNRENRMERKKKRRPIWFRSCLIAQQIAKSFAYLCLHMCARK